MTNPSNSKTEKLALIALDFDIWSGQSKLMEEDIRLGDGGEIPPSELASLGRKSIFDPAKLRVFNKLKTRARRAVLDYGRPFLGGFAIPRKDIQELDTRLEGIRINFEEEVQKFSDNYDADFERWLNKEVKIEYQDIVRRAQLSRDEVKERFSMDFEVLNVVAATDKDEQKLNQRVGSLSFGLMEEIIKKSQDFTSEYLLGDREAVSSSTKATLQNLRDKVDGLSFLNSKFNQIVSLFDRALSSYPESGKVDGENFASVVAVCLVLSDESKLARYIEGEIDLSVLNGVHAQNQEESLTDEDDDDGSDESQDLDDSEGGLFF